MRLTILSSPLADCTLEFYRNLVRFNHFSIQIIFQPSKSNAPYKSFDLSLFDQSIQISEDISIDQLINLINDFGPNCILMSSWNYKKYMKAAKLLKKNNIYVISMMDNQYHGTIKQKLGILFSCLLLKKTIDNFLVCSDRQAIFAKKLGYDDVLYGLYAANINYFANNVNILKRPKNFIFVARLVPEKGLIFLLDAYHKYRKNNKNPWGLIIVGTGPLKHLVNDADGVDYKGFVQPAYLPEIYLQGRCFILPSLFEPWGIVIQEAASSGLPIIASNTCGATVDYVRDGRNGYLITPTPEGIEKSMTIFSQLSDKEIIRMSEISKSLGLSWSPKLLASYFSAKLKNLLDFK